MRLYAYNSKAREDSLKSDMIEVYMKQSSAPSMAFGADIIMILPQQTLKHEIVCQFWNGLYVAEHSTPV